MHPLTQPNARGKYQTLGKGNNNQNKKPNAANVRDAWGEENGGYNRSSDYLFVAHHAPTSRHSPQLVPPSLIKSFIILPIHTSHSSWLLPLASRRTGSSDWISSTTMLSAIFLSAACPAVSAFFSTFWCGPRSPFIST
uniref:Uncharacterized protein n=1 Tax=Bionectria ochroleuca TaxID=29856 RepID=A0A0B7JWY4_BIOOC